MITRDGTPLFYYLLPTMRPYIENHLQQVYERGELLVRFGAAYFRIVSFLYHEFVRDAVPAVIAQQVREDAERAVEYVAGPELGYYLLYWAQILRWLGSTMRGLMLL